MYRSPGILRDYGGAHGRPDKSARPRDDFSARVSSYFPSFYIADLKYSKRKNDNARKRQVDVLDC